MTDITQINNYLTLVDNYDSLNSQEILSYLKSIPEDWAKDVLREKIIKSYGKVGKDEFAHIIDDIVHMSHTLNLEIESTVPQMSKEYNKFKEKKQILRSSITLINKYYENEKIEFEFLDEKVIKLIEEISIQTEHYELLSELQNKKLI